MTERRMPMPVLDGNFEAFVTNLGKYNEGMLVGEWVKLPTTEEEMQKVFERIGIGKQDEFGQPYEEWFITDYECPIYGVQKMLGEYESLDKLNYLAAADCLLYLGYLFFIWIDPYFYCPVYLSHPDSLYTDGLFQQVLYFKDFFCSL